MKILLEHCHFEDYTVGHYTVGYNSYVAIKNNILKAKQNKINNVACKNLEQSKIR